MLSISCEWIDKFYIYVKDPSRNLYLCLNYLVRILRKFLKMLGKNTDCAIISKMLITRFLTTFFCRNILVTNTRSMWQPFSGYNYEIEAGNYLRCYRRCRAFKLKSPSIMSTSSALLRDSNLS